MDHNVLDSVFAEMAKQAAPAQGDDASPHAAAAEPAGQPLAVGIPSQPPENNPAAATRKAARRPPQTPSDAPSGARVWLGRAWLAGCLLLAGYLALRAMPGSPFRSAPPSRNQQASQPRTKPIEEVDIFDRVLGTNPLLSESERNVPEPDPATWRVLRLRLTKKNGKLLHAKLARPLSWIKRAGAEQGKTFYLALPEMGVVGDAEVLAIESCPSLKPGKGSVVTGTVKHEADDNLINIRLEGLDEPIGCTDNHPFWSEDRQDYIAGGELRIGERVQSRVAGVIRVVSITPRPRERWVYNLEVHGQHVYEVSKVGVLVHNTCTLAQATSQARQAAGIPLSQQPIRQWTIRDVKGGPFRGPGRHHPDPTHQGRIYEYEIRGQGGQKEYRYIIVHDIDPTHGGVGHVHVGQSPAGPTHRLNPGDNYRNLDAEFLGGNPIPFDRR